MLHLSSDVHVGQCLNQDDSQCTQARPSDGTKKGFTNANDRKAGTHWRWRAKGGRDRDEPLKGQHPVDEHDDGWKCDDGLCDK